MTVVSDYRALLSNSTWDSAGAGTAALITYSFSTAPTAYLSANNAAAAASFSLTTASEQATIKASLAQWSAASGITFQQVVNTPGDITFGFYNLTAISGSTGEAGLGNFPSTGTFLDSNGAPQVFSNFLPQGGDVYFDTSYQTNPFYLSDFGHIAIHEIGHALGLKHPFDTATFGQSYTLDPSLDNGSETVMAYVGARAATLGPLDIQAIQSLYGMHGAATDPYTEVWNPATESATFTTSATQPLAVFGTGGNDVFYSLGEKDALSGGEGDDVFYLAGKPASVNGGTGSDTVVTGLNYVAGQTIVQQDPNQTGTRYIYLSAYNDFQLYVNVATLVFTNGIYNTASNVFDSFASVISPGTIRPDSYTWSGAGGGAWGSASNWSDKSAALTLLPPGANNLVSIVGSALSGAPAVITGIGRAAAVSLSTGYVAIAGSLGLGTLSVGGSGAAGLTVASGGSIAVSGQATVVQSAAQQALGSSALTVASGGTMQLGSLVLNGSGGLQYAKSGIGAATVAVGTGIAASPTLVLAADAMANSAAGIDRTATAAAASTLAPNAAGGLGADLVPEVPGSPDPNDAPALAPALDTLSGTLSIATAAGTSAAPVVAISTAPAPALQASATAGTIEIGTLGTAAAGTLTIDPGRSLSGTGAVASLVVNNGTIIATGGQLAFTQAVSGTGSLQITGGSTLALTGSLNESVSFSGSGSTLDLLYLAAPASTQSGVINGFKAGDVIEVVGSATATGLTYHNSTPNTGVLTLTRGTTVVAALQLSGNYAASQFQLTSNASGTTDLTLTAPDPMFDPAYYLAHNLDVLAAGADPYQHYLQFGWKEGRDPSAHFDTRYYLTQNPDVAAANVNPLQHFEQYGWKEGRQPSLVFDDAKYLAQNGDVAAAAVDPLLHYIEYGQAEGRAAFLTGGSAPSDLLVNAGYYDAQLGATLIPAGTAGAQQAAYAYHNGGWQAGLNPNAWFDTKYYLSHNQDVAAAHVDPLLHYELYGWKEGRDPSAAFSTAKYNSVYADVKAAGVDPLLHFVAYGQSEGRSAFAV